VILLDSRSSALQPKDLTSKPTWAALPAVKANQVTPWLSELRYSYTACAPLVETLAAYLDGFGDIRAAAQTLQVHPNTVRYRVRRIEKLLSTSLADPDVRLLFSLGLRVLETIGDTRGHTE